VFAFRTDGRYVEDELLGLFFEECVYQLARDEPDEEDRRPGHEHFSEEELREFVEEALFKLVDQPPFQRRPPRPQDRCP